MPLYREYIEKVQRTLDAVLACQAKQMEAAIDAVYTCLAKDGMVYTFGTGHGHLLAEEVFYRAGGLARVCPILDERLLLHLSATGSTDWEREEGLATRLLSLYPVKAGDVLMVFSNSGRNAAPVEIAVAARAKGVYVIALTNLRHSMSASARNSFGKNLYQVADLVLNNGGEIGDAAMRLKDGRAVGPTSTAIGAAMLQAIVVGVAERAEQDGAPIEFYASSNIDGGDAINEKLIAKYRPMIRHL